MKPTVETEEDGGRRAFLKQCGRYAAITPPAVTFLLSTSMSSKAIAASSGRPGNGFGDKNHDHWGPPGAKAAKSERQGGSSGAKGPKVKNQEASISSRQQASQHSAAPARKVVAAGGTMAAVVAALSRFG